jgi:choline dehydrogenase-like flavoprotein
MPSQRHYDAIVVGSGFGGAMTAHAVVAAGGRVLLLERGDWVRRGPHNWRPESVGFLGPYYSTDAPYEQIGRSGRQAVGAFQCVGGPSVFYGGVALRLREADFEPDPDIVKSSGARWPFGYAELEPYYSRAEQLLGVAGQAGVDPTEPPRSSEYPQPSAPLAPISRRIAAAASSLGLTPFPLPLAINHGTAGGRTPCQACGTCDGFACAVEAKNDLATTVIRPLLGRGLDLRANAVVRRLVTDGQRITAVETVDRRSGRIATHAAERVFLAAGALGSPHLLLSSGLARLNPGGHVVGRFLMRHFNEVILGFFATPPDRERRFHKQLGIHDLYLGDPGRVWPRGKLGGIQQLATPPGSLVRAHLPRALGAVARLVDHLTGLLVIAEDQPSYANRVFLGSKHDRLGMRQLQIDHCYSARDRAAGRVLRSHAQRILRRAGAWICVRHAIGTFSHAVGTVRMGTDRRTSALDADCRFRGLANLFVVDGSSLPTSGGVNPSLTIAAIALRAATRALHLSTPFPRALEHVHP